jgi:transposase
MSNPADRVEIITSVQRRRRWTAAEKVRMVEIAVIPEEESLPEADP